MAEKEKLSCSELKKIQLKKRRANSIIKNENILQLNINVPLLKKDSSCGDNDSFTNPFAKIQSNNLCDNLINTTSADSAEINHNIVFNELEYLAPQTEISSCQKIIEPDHFIIEKSLKSSVIFETNLSLSYLKTKLSDPDFLMQKMKCTTKDNLSFYYRYPDANLPSTQKKNIHKALSAHLPKSNKTDENLIWYKMFSEKWRKALLSAFETLKHGLIECFYFVQENLTVLFEFDDRNSSLKAFMQLSTLALAEDLTNHGIEYKILSKIGPNLNLNNDTDKNSNADEIIEADEDENVKHEELEIQLKRPKTFFTKKDIMIEGSLSLAELVDFLINQKDRNSYAILPEIYSPGPFVYGTLRSNLVNFSGACKGLEGELTYQLKISGIIFPGSIWALFRELKESGHKVNTIVERDAQTDFLSAYTYQ